MAMVYLRADGREITNLPPVCLVCGSPATVRKSKQFSWIPVWVRGFGVIPLVYIILAALFTKKQRVETPLCGRHATYWWLMPTIVGVGLVCVLGLGVVAMVAMEALKGPNVPPVGEMLCFASAIGLVAVLIFAIAMNWSRIRPKEITDQYLHLENVSQEFVDAIENEEENYRRAFDRDAPAGPRRPKRLELADDERIREEDDDQRYQR